MTFPDIDFGHLYRQHMAAAGRRPRSAGAWDARAAGVERKLAQGDYVQAFIARMDLDGCDSMLDVGCGAGALSLPLATRLRRIVALDYSQAMLDALERGAHAQGIGNIETRLCAWEDDWSEVPECDIAIASRSTQADDMAAALAKLDSKARKRVYLTHRVGGQALAPDILDALGRHPASVPDYIYVLNILHTMGVHARVDYLDGGAPVAIGDAEDLLRRVEWSLGALDAGERVRLRDWHACRDPGTPLCMPARRWAFIAWEKPGVD